eukprot:gene13361-biopygen12963
MAGCSIDRSQRHPIRSDAATLLDSVTVVDAPAQLQIAGGEAGAVDRVAVPHVPHRGHDVVADDVWLQVWRSDAPLVGARTTLRKDDRVRLKRAVSLNGGAVVVAAGREGVVTRPPRGKACVRVQVGDNEWSEDEADDVLELLGGQRPYSAALPGPNPGRSI